jgi:protein TonB
MSLRDYAGLLKRAGEWLPESRYPLSLGEWSDRIAQAVLFSCIVHVVVFFGIGWKPANPEFLAPPNPPLDVVLVNARSAAAPMKADVLAQVNLDGGGDVDEERQIASPLPASPVDQAPDPGPRTEARVESLEQQARELLTQIKSSFQAPETLPRATPEPAPTPAPNPIGELSQRALEMARLMGNISKDWEAYQKRPRRENASARAKEYAYARYVEDWRVKIERIGNLNYPEAARREHIYGSLILTVAINGDGSLEGVYVSKPSGSRILDAAAIKIVELAAPFAPFPAEMRKQLDILEITRTWTFTSEDNMQTSSGR